MKKMTLNTLSKIEKSIPSTRHIISFDVDGENIDIEVKPYISLQEQSDIIDSSVQAAFTKEGYSHEYKEAVFKYKIIDTLTNIPLLKKKDNIDLVRYCEIYDRLGLEAKIQSLSDYMCNLIIDLRTAINEKLEYQKQLVVHSNRTDELVDAVVSFLDTATKTVEDLGGSLKGLDVSNINELIGKVSKDGVSPDLLKGILDMGSETVLNLEVVK